MASDTDILWLGHAPRGDGRSEIWAAKAVRIATLVYLLPVIALVFAVGGLLALACKVVGFSEDLVNRSLHRAGSTSARWSLSPGHDLIGRDSNPASSHAADCEPISKEG